VSVAPLTPAGIYTIVYMICDSIIPTSCDTATITITVEAPDIIAANDSATVSGFAGSPSLLNVLNNDSINNGPVTASGVTITVLIPAASPGVILDPITGNIIVSPQTNPGIYVITYMICDTLNPGNCDTAIVTVTVTNAPPVANPDSVSLVENGSITFNPLINDFDIDGNLDPTSVAIIGGPSNGVAVVDSVTGEITYTPNVGWFGVDTIFYMVCDSGVVPILCDTSYIVINVISLPVIDVASLVHVDCYGESTGSATVGVTLGAAPYQIEWNTTPIQTGPTATNLSAGNYVVTVTDSIGSIVNLSVTIFENDSLVMNYVSTSSLCYDSANGSANLFISGGVAPYEVLWSTGDTGVFVTGLMAGRYTVSITDSLGCTLQKTVTITEPDLLEVSSVDIVNVKCKEDAIGGITPTIIGGIPPYRYLWSTGDTTAFLSEVPGGDYYLDVLDSNNCPQRFYFSVEWQLENCTQGVLIPQGVSPNGDGANDNFFIKGLEDYPNASLKIFNRWGSLVYQTDSYQNDWSGQVNTGFVLNTNNGKVPSGTYYYVIILQPGNQPLAGYFYLTHSN
jgi:gliding motility-associated-like protein